MAFRFWIILFSIFASFSLNAEGAASEFDFKKFIPEKVLQVIGAKEEVVRKLWGQPNHSESKQLFYEEANYRYRLIVEVKNKEAAAVEYVLISPEVSLGAFLASGKFQGSDVKDFPEKGHSQGRYLELTHKDRQNVWSFYFRNNTEKKLHHFRWERKP